MGHSGSKKKDNGYNSVLPMVNNGDNPPGDNRTGNNEDEAESIIKQWPVMPKLQESTQKEVSGVKYMFNKKKKVLKRWTRIDECVKIISKLTMGLTMVSITMVSVIAGITASPGLSYAAAILAAFGALKKPLEKLLITDLTTKKRIKYMDKCRIIRECLEEVNEKYLEATKPDSSSGVEIDIDEHLGFEAIVGKMSKKLFELDFGLLAEYRLSAAEPVKKNQAQETMAIAKQKAWSV